MYGSRRATYDVEDGALGVAGELVLGGVTDQTLVVGESDPGRSDTVTCRERLSAAVRSQRCSGKLTLVVDQNVDLAVPHNTNTRVGCAQIDTNDGSSDGVAVCLLSAGRHRQHQAGDDDHEEVEGNAPCGAVAP